MKTLVGIALLGIVASPAQARDEQVTAEENGAVEGQSQAPRSDSQQIVVEGPEGNVVLESTSAAVYEVGDTALVKLSFVLASRVDGATARVVLRVPSGARLVDMAYSQGGAVAVASLQPVDEARLQFEAAEHGVVDWRTLGRSSEVRVPVITDPALLELTSEDRDRQNYRLSVYPMFSFDRTTATVSIAMPRFRRLIVVRGDRRSVPEVEVFRAATEADVALTRRSSAVARSTALYAAPTLLPVAHPALHASISRESGNLRACFMADRLVRPHDVIVNFAIDDHGAVISPKVSGGSPPLTTCIAKVAQAWRFRSNLATKGTVDYPLHFTP